MASCPRRDPASRRERRGARLTRREEGAYWVYATDEQRNRASVPATAQTPGRHGWAAIGAEGDACRAQAGCIAARMQRGFLCGQLVNPGARCYRCAPHARPSGADAGPRPAHVADLPGLRRHPRAHRPALAGADGLDAVRPGRAPGRRGRPLAMPHLRVPKAVTSRRGGVGGPGGAGPPRAGLTPLAEPRARYDTISGGHDD